MRDREATSRAEERRTARHAADVAAYEAREARRAVVRARIAELGTRIKAGASLDRTADLAELDALWMRVALWL